MRYRKYEKIYLELICGKRRLIMERIEHAISRELVGIIKSCLREVPVCG